jgi:hypothetical protein
VTGPHERLDVYPPGLRSAGDRLRAAAERLDAAWLRHTAAQDTDAFGSDHIGGLIGGSYRVAMEIAEASYTSVSASFSSFAAVLHSMADEFQGTDERGADDIVGSAGQGPA